MTTHRIKSAAYRLFHFRYDMIIPQAFLYGKAYLEKHGRHISGDSALDSQRLMEPSMVKQTVAGLAMLHADGCDIQLMNPKKDTATIYNDIQEHLLDWERLATQGVHPDDAPPIEEFRQLETVALALYEKAKFYAPEEKDSSLLRDRLMDLNRRRNAGRSDQVARNRLRDEKGNLKPYVSIVDRIEKELIGSRKQWQ